VQIKLLAILSVLSVTAWFASVGLIGTRDRRLENLETDAADWIHRAIPQIVTDWDYSAWLLRSTREYRIATDRPQLKRDFKAYQAQLGQFRRITDIKGRVEIITEAGFEIIEGHYTVRCRFRYALADINIRIVKRGRNWRLLDFTVRSEILDPQF
jgi:hypothetical protein